MAIYKFKVVWEENEEVERYILIKSNQTFEDFFNILVEAFELPNKNVTSSFFTSDDYWDKHTEITLRPEDVQGDEKLMSKTKIATQVEQVHQKFVFVYDPDLQLTFHIELIKIEPDKIISEGETLPKIISSKNKIPKRKKQKGSNQDLLTNTSASSLANTMNEDELDQFIYSQLENKKITEEDILSGKFEEVISGTPANQNIPVEPVEDEEDEAEDEIFDEKDNIFDDDEFNQNGYFDDYNDEYEN
ncbi:MAG: hypothetical protein N3F62_10640 [Bacteroidia bacterium]|nr:hypothetical protein [Bacteroidia bacterium]